MHSIKGKTLGFPQTGPLKSKCLEEEVRGQRSLKTLNF